MSERFERFLDAMAEKYVGLRRELLILRTSIPMIGSDALTCNYVYLFYRMIDFGELWKRIMRRLEPADREEAKVALHGFLEEIAMTLRVRCR